MSIDYFRLLIIARYNQRIAININLNVLQQIIIKTLKKEFRSHL